VKGNHEMTSSTRFPIKITLAVLAALLVTDAATQAQTTLRSRMNDRNRDRQAPATAAPAERETTKAQPVSNVQPATQTTLAQNSTENVSGAAGAVRSRVEKELEGQSTEDLIRSAQQRLSTMRSGSSTPTISDVSESAAKPATPTNAQPVAAPPAQARAVAAPIPAPAAAPVPASDAPRPAATAPSLLASPADVPAPIPLRPKYEREKSANQAMEIESDESVMDNTQRIVTFQGNVFVNHPDFKLASDHLEIHLNEDGGLDGMAPTPLNAKANDSEDAPPFKRAIATGGMVEIEKIGADGKTQIAKARKADYDANTGDIVLSGGPPTLQSGTGFVNPSSPDALIILRGSGQHEVKGGVGGRNTFSIPIKGGAKTTTTPLSGSLDTITNRNDNR
jgi:lipopolysaccharide export system protein LptA